MYPQASHSDPAMYLARTRPDHPVMFFDPARLGATTRRFLRGFPGMVTYAVKANPGREVLENLVACGVTGFDVASPGEIALVRDVDAGAALHYNNPVRARGEVTEGVRAGVASWSVDCPGELDKLGAPRFAGEEVAVRLALPVKGAHYDFGEKFGLAPGPAAALLAEVARRGFQPAICFHPGTQCADPEAWAAYVAASADVARQAGVRLARLNVGGGFASHRDGTAPDLEAIFTRIGDMVDAAFDVPPGLVCEPGRAMVAESFTLGLRIKAIRGDGSVFLNDGLYGGLAELRDIGPNTRLRVLAPDGRPRDAAPRPRVGFGPTCDSLDRLPEPLNLPGDVQEGDFVLIEGMGAYSLAIATRFNGYGVGDVVTLARAGAQA